MANSKYDVHLDNHGEGRFWTEAIESVMQLKFGIFADALTLEITGSKFFSRYCYCLWWGLRNLSSAGQNLLTSTHVAEINFSVIVAILGLVLFALLIGAKVSGLYISWQRQT